MDNLSQKAKENGIPIIRENSHDILIKLVKNSNAKRILEIGTAIGYSGIAMLKNSNAKLTTIEHNKDFVKQAHKNFKKEKLSKRVTIIYGDALVEVAKMVASKKYDGYFDFIFLDGPKAQYSGMLENLLILLANGGTFVADNVLFHGYIDGKNAMPTKRYKTIVKRLNDFIENCKKHPNLTKFELISVEDGMIFAKKVNNENK